MHMFGRRRLWRIFGLQALDIGLKVTFANMGVYTMSKAHPFDGIILPTIYTRKSDGAVQLIKEDTFDEYASTPGVIKSVPV
jgi:hypothetical protein